MEGPADNSNPNSRRRFPATALNTLRFPISSLLEYFDILSSIPTPAVLHQLQESRSRISSSTSNQTNPNLAGEEVSVRIGGAADRDGTLDHRVQSGDVAASSALAMQESSRRVFGVSQPDEHVGSDDTEAVDRQGADDSNNDTDNQRYSIQQLTRWLEQIVPFSVLLLFVFIRQHWQGLSGFLMTIWTVVFMYKSNGILKRQTALKGERKLSSLFVYCIGFILHIILVSWWFKEYKLRDQLIMLPPEDVPPFWNAILIVVINDMLVRQAAMVLKCFVLMYYRNSRGRKYRRQGQILTLMEYLLLLYRALLPAPIWYRFFLNNEYGSIFSSLMAALYVILKLASLIEKVQSLVTAVKALSRIDLHYGALATSEQVAASGDMCAICQEKIHVPILLQCKHIFCEDCVSEWFQRERTCPLCRTIVKPAGLKSYSDGSTSLRFELC